MIICLSSGSRERYRQDVILSLAMPENYVLQFRYDKKWISSAVLEKIQNKSIIRETALIVYVDQYDKMIQPELIPCRIANVISCSEHGSTISLQFNLKEIAYAKDIQAFNREIHSLSVGTIVNWDQNKKPKGHYCVWVENNNLSTMVLSKDLIIWESVVSQIAERKEFANEKTFYTIESLVEVDSNKIIPPYNGVYSLKSSREHQLNIYHYHPQEGKSKAYLLCSSKAPIVTNITNPKMLVNSRYDIKHFRFKTEKAINTTRVALTIYRGEGENENEMPMLDFDLILKIKGSLCKNALLGVFVGVLLAIPIISSTISDTQLSSSTKTVLIFLSLLSNIFVGLIASFNFKKGL